MSHFSVTVFCGSSMGRIAEFHDTALAFGAGLAARRMHLVFGGGNVGLMGVVAGSTIAAGGTVTGVIPEFLRGREAEFHGLTELIITDSMHTRKRRMFARGDVFVVLPGGLGTLDELIEILTWKQLGLHAKPILICNVLGWATPLISLLDHLINQGFVNETAHALIETFDGVAPTLARLEAIASQSSVSLNQSRSDSVSGIL